MISHDIIHPITHKSNAPSNSANAVFIAITKWAAILWVLWRHTDGLFVNTNVLNMKFVFLFIFIFVSFDIYFPIKAGVFNFFSAKSASVFLLLAYILSPSTKLLLMFMGQCALTQQNPYSISHLHGTVTTRWLYSDGVNKLLNCRQHADYTPCCRPGLPTVVNGDYTVTVQSPCSHCVA